MRNRKSESHSEQMAAVKREVEDLLEEEHGPSHKRPKNVATGAFAVTASQYNPLDEPSPLGLRLRKSPSLLELIQMKLSESSTLKNGSHVNAKKEKKTSAISGDKLKASNFPASVLRIGTWEYKSRYEGDLVAKCYFAKHKLVWEVLDGGLKNKIEFQWSDIMALKANYPDEGPGTLNVVLARQPLFFRETNPQPRKHTLWQSTSDFTGGQASMHRQHYLECQQGLLGKHFEKLIQCDPRLNILCRQGETALVSPYFEPRNPVLEEPNEKNNEIDLNRKGSPSFFTLQNSTSTSGTESSSSKFDQDALSRPESHTSKTPSPCSDFKSGGMDQLKALGNWDQINFPGLHISMSMSDLVSHLEKKISKHGTSENPVISSEEWHGLEILEDINRCLFSDPQNMPDSDEKLLMSRVNSLCCLLQKDSSMQKRADAPTDEIKVKEDYDILHSKSSDMTGHIQALPMSRKDSFGELLLNLPRIASLPQFLFNISEDLESQAR